MKKIDKKLYLMNKYKGICQLCLFPLSDSEFTFDHIIPKSKGGLNNIENLQPAHYKCNYLKSDNPEAFKTEDYQNYYLNKTTVIKHYRSGKEFSSIGELRLHLDNERLTKATLVRVKKKASYADKVKPKKTTQNNRIVNPNFTKAELIANGKVKVTHFPKLDIPESDKNLSKEGQLWNEIIRNGTKRLSYEMFKSYF